ncbi:MAG: hypothetical protein K9I85_14690 [Saprospiraceae bacterium]|nr:hypothetical protein [Saprospiraceae bacterium]
MKHSSILLVLVLTCMYSLQISAQDLNNFDPVAWYTLIDSTGDKLDMNPPSELTNAPFQGSDGVYSNGQYPFSGQPGGSWISTPNLSELYDSSFAVSLQFRIDSLDDESHPIIIMGDSWRYLGFSVLYDNRWVVDFNGYAYTLPDTKAIANQWYEVTIIYSSADSTALYYLDGALINQKKGALIRDINDGRITNTHSGAGRTFRGHWRHLRVFRSNDLFSSINQAVPSQMIQLFPNPTIDHLVITQEGDGFDRWEIIDLALQLPALCGIWTSSQIEISTATLPAGLYVLRAWNHQTYQNSTHLFLKH